MERWIPLYAKSNEGPATWRASVGQVTPNHGRYRSRREHIAGTNPDDPDDPIMLGLDNRPDESCNNSVPDK